MVKNKPDSGLKDKQAKRFHQLPSFKFWSNGKISIGQSSGNGVRELQGTIKHDTINIFPSAYDVYGCFNSDKPKNVTFKQGDFSFAMKGTENYSLSEQRGDSYFLEFDPIFRQSMLDEIAPSSMLDEPLTATSGLRNKDFHFHMIKDFVDSNGVGDTLRAEAILTLLLVDVLETLDKKVDTPPLQNALDHKKLALVEEYIDAHLDKKFGIDELAELVGISQFHFARMFKVATGLPPHQFVMQHRVKRAQALLEDKSLSLAQISYVVGFSSQSHMSDVFRKMIGVTPGIYRKSL